MNELSVDALNKILWSDGFDTSGFTVAPDGMTYTGVSTSSTDILVGPVWDLETDDPIIDLGDLKIFEIHDGSFIYPDDIEDYQGLSDFISSRY